MAVISSEGIIYMKDDSNLNGLHRLSQMGMKSVALTGAKSVIVGNEGAIWQYTDQTWWNRTKFHRNLHDVDFNGDEDGLAVGDSGPFLQQMMVAPHGIIGSHQTQIVQSFYFSISIHIVCSQ